MNIRESNSEQEKITKEYSVKGMDCPACALKIERELHRLGVTDSVVNFPLEILTVSVAHEQDLLPIRDAVNKLGFTLESSQEESKDIFSDRTLIIICLVCTIPLYIDHFSLAALPAWLQAVLALPPTLVGIYRFGRGAIGSILAFRPNMELLIILGVLASYVSSLIALILFSDYHHLFFETAATIVTFMLIGNTIERRAVSQTTRGIRELINLQPRNARRIRKSGISQIIEDIDVKEVHIGDHIIVPNGERIPVNGRVISGDASIDCSLITGESVPIITSLKSDVLAGSLVLSGSITLEATSTDDGSYITQMIKLIRDSQLTKPKIQRIGDTVSSFFIPIVLFIALLTGIYNFTVEELPWSQVLLRSLSVIIIACPCAMGLATPTAIAVAIGRATRAGILVKNGEILEELARVRIVAFDKTGTLTSPLHDTFSLTPYSTQYPIEETKNIVYALANQSTHPLSKQLTIFLQGMTPTSLKDIQETPGLGISGYDDSNTQWSLGSSRFIAHNTEQNLEPHLLYLVKDGIVILGIDTEEAPYTSAPLMMKKLNRLNLHLWLLSGDSPSRTEKIGTLLGFQQIRGALTPVDKANQIKELTTKNKTLFVGDGINDTVSLNIASVGMSFRHATQIAANTAGVIILREDLTLIPQSIKLARKTAQTIRRNLFWAFFYNIIAIPFAAKGALTPPMAALIMFLSDVMVIGNSLLLRWRRI